MARTTLLVTALVVAAFLAGMLVTLYLGGGNFATTRPENTVNVTTVQSEAERKLEEVCTNMRMKLLTTPEGTISTSERTNLERQVRQQCAQQSTTSTTEES